MLDVNAKGNKSVRELAKWYHNETVNLRSDPLSKAPWAFANYEDGTPILTAERRIYRERVDLQRAFRNPYDPAGYLAWFNTQGRLEFPGLFSEDDEEKAMALTKIVGPLTPGYQGGESSIDWKKIRGLVFGDSKDNRTLGNKIKSGLGIAKTDGVKGLRKRIVK